MSDGLQNLGFILSYLILYFIPLCSSQNQCKNKKSINSIRTIHVFILPQLFFFLGNSHELFFYSYDTEMLYSVALKIIPNLKLSNLNPILNMKTMNPHHEKMSPFPIC